MRTDAPRSEFVANLAMRRDPRAPIVGASFHVPAPRRNPRARRIGRAAFVAGLAVLASVLLASWAAAW